MKTDANANFNMGISAEYKVLRNINMKILNVVGARPNFMKIAPIVEKMKQAPDLEPILVHTGQHYSEGMSDVFFRDLGIIVLQVRRFGDERAKYTHVELRGHQVRLEGGDASSD